MVSTNANTFFIRRSELTNGIAVKHEQSGQDFGNSKIAAREAITKTMLSRASYCVPIFFFPAVWNYTIQRLGRGPKPRTPLGNCVEVIGVALGLAIAMPVNCALYPQISDIEVSKLETDI